MTDDDYKNNDSSTDDSNFGSEKESTQEFLDEKQKNTPPTIMKPQSIEIGTTTIKKDRHTSREI